MEYTEFAAKLQYANPNQFPERDVILEMMDGQFDELKRRKLPRGVSHVDANVFSKLIYVLEMTPISGATCRFVRIRNGQYYIDINEQL